MPKKRVTKKSTSAAKKRAAKKTPTKQAPAKKRPAGKAAKKATKKAPKRAAARKRVAAGADSAGSAQLENLQRLIELMVEKEVVEVEIEEEGARWRVRRAEAPAVHYAAAAPMPMPAAHAPATGPAPAAAGAEAAPAEPQGEVFKSPMVGTFYRAPSPDAEPFSKPGDKVSADSTLCIIEAMKVMNEIKAEREFEILDILVKDGESVEFGQPLFTIR